MYLKWLSRMDALRRGLLVVLLGFSLGFVGLVRAPESGTGEAFAAIAAALVGIGGAEIGRGSGIQRDHGLFHRLLWPLSAAAILLALVLIAADRNDAAAGTTLLLAAIGLLTVHHAHEKRTFNEGADGDERLGWALVAAAVLGGMVAVLAFKDWAEAGAAFAASVVTSGGTLLGHARGRRQAT